MKDFPENILDLIEANLGGFNRTMGLTFLQAKPEEFIAELEIGPQHRQPYGLVHGGVYAGMIETLCSTGAALNVMADGKSTVGLENTTAFLRAVRQGKLRCIARPLLMGKRSHVWEAEIRDDRERLAATGRVRLLVLDPQDKADGVVVALENPMETKQAVTDGKKQKKPGPSGGLSGGIEGSGPSV